VVGKPATNTVIFNGDLKYVVLAPYWNVPYSIVKNEMGRTPSYFAKRNMEVIGKYADGLPMVRQKPGGANALGRVKFLFPNSYSIYLHDTPSKGAFGQQQRAFSHGCIRLAQPVKLAEWLLRNDPNWPPDKMAKTMQGSKEVTVTIAKPVPVFIGYFTCWVNEQGEINFRKDLYGHDKKMESLLFHSPQ
jgi:murein L,D-transpeptidase YcbB/YkuD